MATSDSAQRNRRKSAKAAARLRSLLRRERELWDSGRDRVAGVDEAGAGPLAGPIVAAAVIFRPGCGLKGVDDSKRVAPARRVELAQAIRDEALTYHVARVDPEEIDSINIYWAGMLAMRRAVSGLSAEPDFLLVDGRQIPDVAIEQEKVIGGDRRCHAIAAASILAKTARDELMVRYDADYPGYGFAAHKGYPTAEHRDAIRRLGSTPIHRRSFTLLPQPRLWD